MVSFEAMIAPHISFWVVLSMVVIMVVSFWLAMMVALHSCALISSRSSLRHIVLLTIGSRHLRLLHAEFVFKLRTLGHH